MFSWISWTLILATLALLHEVKAQCSFTTMSPETFVSGTDIFCSSNEETDVGNVICHFKASNAISIRFGTEGPLNAYNTLDFTVNGDGTLDVKVTVKASYSSYVDSETHDIATANTIGDTPLFCTDSTSNEKESNFFVTIKPENTQKPIFSDTSGSYTFNLVPETMPPGIDFTTLSYGDGIITASDEDGSFGAEDHPQSAIVFEIQGEGSADFEVKTVEVTTTSWPHTYRAAISLKRILDFDAHPDYTFTLVARNEDNNLVQTSTTQVKITVEDIDNLDPVFDYNYYSATVSESMISTPGSHTLDTTPPISAHDQDIGIDQALTFSIADDCGDSEICDIITNSFKIDASTGVITFISDGTGASGLTTLSFVIEAVQTDNDKKRAAAIVTVEFPPATTTTAPTTTTATTPTTTTETTTAFTCPTPEPTTTPEPCVCTTESTTPTTTETTTAFTCPTPEPTTTPEPCVCTTEATTPTTTKATTPFTCPPTQPCVCTTDATTATTDGTTSTTNNPTCPTITCPTCPSTTCPSTGETTANPFTTCPTTTCPPCPTSTATGSTTASVISTGSSTSTTDAGTPATDPSGCPIITCPTTTGEPTGTDPSATTHTGTTNPFTTCPTTTTCPPCPSTCPTSAPTGATTASVISTGSTTPTTDGGSPATDPSGCPITTCPITTCPPSTEATTQTSTTNSIQTTDGGTTTTGSTECPITTCPSFTPTATTGSPTTAPGPHFDQDAYTVVILDSIETGTIVLTVNAGVGVTYEISACTCDGCVLTTQFTINANTGDISVRKHLTVGEDCLKVTAEDGDGLTDDANVYINVLSSTECPTTAVPTTSVCPTSGTGSTQSTASTPTGTGGTATTLKTTPGETTTSESSVNPTTCPVITCPTTPITVPTTTVTTPTTTLPPEPNFDQDVYSAVIYDSLPVGTKIMTVNAGGSDNVAYTREACDGGMEPTDQFRIDAKTGAIYVNSELVIGEYCFKVIATDSELDMQDDAKVLIQVINGQDGSLYSFSQQVFNANASEDSPIETLVIDLNSIEEENDAAFYRFSEGNDDGYFNINKSTGEIFINKPLNQKSGTFLLKVTTKGAARSYVEGDKNEKDDVILDSDEAFVIVNVTDINDSDPTFPPGPYQVGISSEIYPTLDVMNVTATDDDLDENNKRVYYSAGNGADQGAFYVNQDTGMIRCKSLLRPNGNTGRPYKFEVKASNQISRATASAATLKVDIFFLEKYEVFQIQKPLKVEDLENNIQEELKILTDILKMNVRALFWEANQSNSSNLYVYAFNNNGVVNKEDFMSAIEQHQEELGNPKVTAADDIPKFQATTDGDDNAYKAATIALSVILIILVIAAAILGVVTYKRRKARKLPHREEPAPVTKDSRKSIIMPFVTETRDADVVKERAVDVRSDEQYSPYQQSQMMDDRVSSRSFQSDIGANENYHSEHGSIREDEREKSLSDHIEIASQHSARISMNEEVQDIPYASLHEDTTSQHSNAPSIDYNDPKSILVKKSESDSEDDEESERNVNTARKKSNVTFNSTEQVIHIDEDGE